MALGFLVQFPLDAGRQSPAPSPPVFPVGRQQGAGGGIETREH